MRIDFEITYRGETVNLDETASQMVVSFTLYDGNFPNGGSGAVSSVNGKTGAVVLDASDIAETSTLKWLTSTLKGYYDTAYNWVNTNGSSVLQSISDLQTAIGNRYTKSETDNLLNNKVDKVSGKGLSENDLTNALKSSYDSAVTDKHTHGNKSILDLIEQPLTTALKATYDGYGSQISEKANITEVQCIISKMPSEVTLTTLSGEQILYTHYIPANTLSAKDLLIIRNVFNKSTSTGITNLKMRVTENAVPGSFIGTQILASYNTVSAATFIPFDRNRIFIKNNSTWLSIHTTISLFDDTSANSYQEKSFNRTVDLYIHITAQNVVTTDVLSLNSSVILKQ